MGTHTDTATNADQEAHPPAGSASGSSSGNPSTAQRAWLHRGLDQPGGKLPLFDDEGQQVCERTVRSCIDRGWAEPWFSNPLKPDWIVCKLTDAGRAATA